MRERPKRLYIERQGETDDRTRLVVINQWTLCCNVLCSVLVYNVSAQKCSRNVRTVSWSDLSEMATACNKRKRLSYDAEFKLRIIEYAENSNNYAAVQVLKNYLRLIRSFPGGDLYARATYTRVYMVGFVR